MATSVGCFNSSTPLDSQGTYTYQSKGYCLTQCTKVDATVMAMTGGNECLCGTTLPSRDSEQSDDTDCNSPCSGYPSDTCGGDGYYSVFYTTDNTDVSYYSGSSSSSSSSSSSVSSADSSKSTGGSSPSTTQKAQVITSVAPGTTIVITQVPTAASTSSASTDSAKSSHGGHNTVGIAVGVVVGIVVAAALAAAAFVYFRRRNRQNADETFGKHQQIPESLSSQRPMANANDARLDHDAMAHRRMSDGSIADNEDYSRRILKVTNPDDR